MSTADQVGAQVANELEKLREQLAELTEFVRREGSLTRLMQHGKREVWIKAEEIESVEDILVSGEGTALVTMRSGRGHRVPGTAAMFLNRLATET